MEKKVKEQEFKCYVEIGPNLRAVLELMLSKIDRSGNGAYLNIAFSPICHLINQLTNYGDKNEKNI